MNWRNPMKDPNFTISREDVEQLLPGDIIQFGEINWYVHVEDNNTTTLVPFKSNLPLVAFERVITLSQIRTQKDPFEFWEMDFGHVMAPCSKERRKEVIPFITGFTNILFDRAIVLTTEYNEHFFIEECRDFHMFELETYDCKNPIYEYATYIINNFIEKLPQNLKEIAIFQKNILETNALLFMPLLTPIQVANAVCVRYFVFFSVIS